MRASSLLPYASSVPLSSVGHCHSKREYLFYVYTFSTNLVFLFIASTKNISVKLCQTSVLSFINGGILSGYKSLPSLTPWWDPQSRDRYKPPSCQLLENRQYLLLCCTLKYIKYCLNQSTNLNWIGRGDTDDAPVRDGDRVKVLSSRVSRAEADVVVECEARWTGLAALNNVDS